MRVSREQMVANKARILQEASHMFRDQGFDGVSVSDVMKAAGQTHGGFYSHFTSKDDLIAQVIAHSLQGDIAVPKDIEAWIDAYLSPAHRDVPGQGCPTASFAGLMPRQSAEARLAMAQGLRAQIGRLENVLSDQDEAAKRREAIGNWCAMVGAVIMARAVDDPELADELLAETRSWIQDRGETRFEKADA